MLIPRAQSWPLSEALFSGELGPERRRMVHDDLWGRDVRDRRVLEAMARLPRHEFIELDRPARAYEDCPHAIGHGQTISQPYIVAKMTELAAPAAGARVLEIGAGCGYQTAVLLELGARVIALEIVAELAARAAATLARLGYRNFEVLNVDGSRGFPEAAPFDAILMAAAPERLPRALLDQLAPGGRLVAPLGPLDSQHLYLFTRRGEEIETHPCFPVRFVPLIAG